MTDEERAIVDYIAACQGRPLPPQEAFLTLVQTRQVGELPYDPVEGCGYRTEPLSTPV